MTYSSLPPHIAAAFDPKLFRAAGERLVAQLSSHLEQVESGQSPVLPWVNPADQVTAASEWMHQYDFSESRLGNQDVSCLVDRFAEIVQIALDRGNHLHHPHYVGHQVPASVPLAGLFDAIGSVTNQVMAIYEMGPWATAVEHAVTQAIGQKIGWKPDTFAGVVTSGASLANLTALLTARNVTCANVWRQGFADEQTPVLVAHADAHYSIERAAGVLGLGTERVVHIQVDKRRAMDVEHLEQTLSDLKRRGIPVVAVIAFACATPIGAFDDLVQVADVCRRHEVWLHVDAAHGGAACMSKKHRHLLSGLELADSVVCDAHKMFFMPALCALLFYRNPEHRHHTFAQHAPYLFDPLAEDLVDYDSGLSVFECTKRAAAYGIWGTWSLFGPNLFAELVDTTFATAQEFYELLEKAEDFKVQYRPECNIVAFRYLPRQTRNMTADEVNRLQFLVRRQVVESGSYYLVASQLDGQSVMRTTIINPLTTRDHLVGLLDEIRSQGQVVLDGQANVDRSFISE